MLGVGNVNDLIVAIAGINSWFTFEVKEKYKKVWLSQSFSLSLPQMFKNEIVRAFDYMVGHLESLFDEALLKEVNRLVTEHTLSYKAPGAIAGEPTHANF